MGQTANKTRTGENEAMAMAKYLRTSPQKLNLVAQTIRGKNAGKALIDLEFSSRRIAQDVRKVLQSAIANAENNHGLDIDRLYVAEAYVGKSITMKRFRARARGRASKILKPFSRLTVVVREQNDDAKPAAKKAAPKTAAKEAVKKEEGTAKKAPAKKAEAKKDSAKKAPAKKAAAQKTAKKSPANAKADVKTPNKTAEKKPSEGKPATNDPAHTKAKDQVDPKQKTDRGNDQ
jgi:large subunit ribosomal protein L22